MSSSSLPSPCILSSERSGWFQLHSFWLVTASLSFLSPLTLGSHWQSSCFPYKVNLCFFFLPPKRPCSFTNEVPAAHALFGWGTWESELCIKMLCGQMVSISSRNFFSAQVWHPHLGPVDPLAERGEWGAGIEDEALLLSDTLRYYKSARKALNGSHLWLMDLYYHFPLNCVRRGLKSR